MSENERDPIVEKWWDRWGETGVLRHRDVIAQIVAEARADERAKAAQRTEDLQVMLHTCESERDDLRAKLATVEADTRKRVADVVLKHTACDAHSQGTSDCLEQIFHDIRTEFPAPAEPQGPPYPFGKNAKGEQCRDWRWSSSPDPCWVRAVSGSGEHWLPDDANHCEVCGAARVSKEEK